jgi:hypothetical protein
VFIGVHRRFHLQFILEMRLETHGGEDMPDELVLLVPEAPPAEPDAVEAKHRALQPGALRVGLLDNSKANADHLLRLMTEEAGRALGVASVFTQRKGSVAIPATDAVIAQLCREADFVVSAMAD